MGKKGKIALVVGFLIVVIAIGVALALYAHDRVEVENDPVKKVESALGIAFPEGTAFEWQGLDEADSEIFLKAGMPEGSAGEMSKSVEAHANWSTDEMPEDVYAFIYGGVYDGVEYALDIAPYYGIPEAAGDSWIFLDRDAERQENGSFLTRERYNVAFALIDEKSDTLYYYEINR